MISALRMNPFSIADTIPCQESFLTSPFRTSIAVPRVPSRVLSVRHNHNFQIVNVGSNFTQEEERWLREEKRWQREEERWLREEQRWKAERESLHREIRSLQSAINKMGSNPQDVESTTVSIKVDYQSDQKPATAESSEPISLPTSTPQPYLPEESESKSFSAAIGLPESGRATSAPAKAAERRALAVGAEGDDVAKMQAALLEEGFFCGEEDMETSYFTEDTESAVMTWQATLGLPETGIMSPDELAILFGEKAAAAPEDSNQAPAPPAASNPSSAPRATRDVPEIVRYARTSMEASLGADHRVFLLGENRWEQPSRLVSADKDKGPRGMSLTTHCFVCKGEGTLTCAECEGSGDMTIEEQFLEWVEGEAKCLYCDGTGAIECDTCLGSGEKV